MNVNFVNMARDNILSGVYGRFDFCEKLLGKEVLLQERPRFLIRVICTEIDVPAEKINYQTFCSWLRRYKKRCAKLPVSAAKNNIQVNTNIVCNDWKTFIPSEPATVKQHEPIIKIVK